MVLSPESLPSRGSMPILAYVQRDDPNCSLVCSGSEIFLLSRRPHQLAQTSPTGRRQFQFQPCLDVKLGVLLINGEDGFVLKYNSFFTPFSEKDSIWTLTLNAWTPCPTQAIFSFPSRIRPQFLHPHPPSRPLLPNRRSFQCRRSLSPPIRQGKVVHPHSPAMSHQLRLSLFLFLSLSLSLFLSHPPCLGR